jgi:hypothetical protein
MGRSNRCVNREISLRNSILARMKNNYAAAAVCIALGNFFGAAYAADPPPVKEPPPPKVVPVKPLPPVKPVPPPKPGAAARGAVTTTNPGGAKVTTANPRAQGASARGTAPSGAGGAGSAPVPSKTFVGRPGPAGSSEARAANGTIYRRRADGTLLDVHDPRRGIEIHRGLNGDRRFAIERRDHSLVVGGHGKDGYVQQRYLFERREFAHRSYYVNGRLYDRFYRRYPVRGVGFLEVYAPVRYYPLGFYAWAYRPWTRPAPYAWGWAGSPWAGHYAYYFAPSPVYAGPSLWLTDYLIATSLQAAYAAAPPSAAPPPAGPPTLTPEVKQKIAEEVQRQVERETAEAQANQQRPGVEPAGAGVVALLGDNRAHVFVAGADLDLVDPTGRECMLSQGDVVQVIGIPPGAPASANAVVLASKGGSECATAVSVEVPIAALQEMQNHMNETVDQGMAELQAKQGQGGLPAAPAAATAASTAAPFAAASPPPDPNAASEIAQQTQIVAQAEQGLPAGANQPGTRDIPSSLDGTAPPPADSGTAPIRISLGQSIDTVVSMLGAPTRIIDLGAKKIYTYPDMKITFTNGQVSDVQ